MIKFVLNLLTCSYHKIPGDTCVGGFVPDKTKLINLNIICSDGVYLKKGSIKEEDVRIYNLSYKLTYLTA